jgi:tetratricopeptide (TPR) repeat protein
MVKLGLQFHQRGDLARAEQTYRAILVREPENADALHLMGSIRGRQGLTAEGIALMERAIAANPRVSAYHNNLGNLKTTAGDVAGAEESYRRAIRVDRKNADAHLNLGKLLASNARLKEARESFIASLRLAPKSVEAHMSLGRLEESEERFRQALQSYSNAVRLDPGYEPGHLAVGNMQVKLGLLEEAEKSYRTSIAIDKFYVDGFFNLANTLRAQERSSEAVEFYRRALALSTGNDAEIYNNFGLTLSDLKQHTEAEAMFRKAIEVRPDFDDSYFNLGLEMTSHGDEEAGFQILQKAIEINPKNLLAHAQTGVVLQARGFLREAAEAYRRALAIDDTLTVARRNLGTALAQLGEPEGLEILQAMVREEPDDASLNWALAEGQLLRGQYDVGLPGYEWRMKVEELRFEHPEFEQPRWNGEPLEGKSILIYAEQGYGDTMQFVRYVQFVAERGGRVILEVQAALQSWLKTLPYVSECIAKGNPLPEFETYAPLMSLPYIFGTRVETIPPPVSPEVPVPVRRHTEGDPKLQVGIVWGGNPKHIRDRLRSTRLEQWKGLTKVEDVEFTSLQVGDLASQADGDAHGFHFVADCRRSKSFAETAAIVAGLDLVITVDTAVAHLAASMGKPVWVLVYNMVDWRWGLNSERTNWYPSMRLFRQLTPGDWTHVFRDVEASLQEFVVTRQG